MRDAFTLENFIGWNAMARIAIGAMATPTVEMLRVGVGEAPIAEVSNDELDENDVRDIWETMCREALR